MSVNTERREDQYINVSIFFLVFHQFIRFIFRKMAKRVEFVHCTEGHQVDCRYVLGSFIDTPSNVRKSEEREES